MIVVRTKLITDGLIECPEMPHDETELSMEVSDLRHRWY